MVAGDVAAVARIESDFSSPWTKAQILTGLEQKTSITLIAETKLLEIVGWCSGISIHPEAELLKLAVIAGRQRQGVASELLKTFTLLLTQNGVEQIFLEVRSRNSSALNLYMQSGWEKQRKRENYYNNPVDDAVLLVRNLKN